MIRSSLRISAPLRLCVKIPHFAFPPSAIIKRKPLSSTARRAGWVAFFHPQTRHKAGTFPGKKETCCNFALNRIPADARIAIVITRSSGRESAQTSSGEHRENQSRLTSAATIIVSQEEVRERFKRVKPLKEISVEQRGWTLDILNAIRRLGKTEFSTADAYTFTRELEKLHPDNRHVKDKIRQQLQVLRDAGLLFHVERGVWRLP